MLPAAPFPSLLWGLWQLQHQQTSPKCGDLHIPIYDPSQVWGSPGTSDGLTSGLQSARKSVGFCLVALGPSWDDLTHLHTLSPSPGGWPGLFSWQWQCSRKEPRSMQGHLRPRLRTDTPSLLPPKGSPTASPEQKIQKQTDSASEMEALQSPTNTGYRDVKQ